MNPKRQAAFHQQRQARHHASTIDANALLELLNSPALSEQVTAALPAHRNRQFPPLETLSLFMGQALSTDRSCQKAVNELASKRLQENRQPCSTHTGGYCRARQRLPIELVSSLARGSGSLISRRCANQPLWQTRPVRLVDGTTLSMPDTTENQAAYPQSRAQKPGLGFPICRAVGIICLNSGAILDASIGRFRGKGGDEQTLLRSMLDTLEHGDLLMGDAFYATYFLLHELQRRGVDGVFEQYGARRRNTDFRRGKKLGERDHLIELHKPRKRPAWMTQEDYEQVPETLTVRELKAGGKILVTTLNCAKQTPKASLKELFKQRWHVELDLRNLKSTLGLEVLSCKTPQMAIKEFWVYLLAYNLIRLLMTESALLADCMPRQLSFKHSVQLWLTWRLLDGCCDDDVFVELLKLIAQKRVGRRPGRIEPRAVKRRPKPYPLMTQKRTAARRKIRRSGHPKKLK